MFREAVAAYSVHELRARFDRQAVTAAREGARSTGLFMLGERHKRPETPRAIYTLMRRLGFRSLALEWERDLKPLIDDFFEEGDDATAALSEDGRITEGHFALLARLRDEGRLERLILMDETSREWTGNWRERDAGMARRLLSERTVEIPTLVVAGGFHTTLAEEPTMATLIARDVPRVPTGVLDYPAAPRIEGRFSRDKSGDFVFALPSGAGAI